MYFSGIAKINPFSAHFSDPTPPPGKTNEGAAFAEQNTVFPPIDLSALAKLQAIEGGKGGAFGVLLV